MGQALNSVAAELGIDGSKLSRMELAKAYVTEHDLARLCDVYDVEAGRRSELASLLVGKRPRHWWRAYADVMNTHLTEFVALENDADEEIEYNPMIVCGLLQTTEYMTQIMGSGFNAYGQDQVESLAAVRQMRQRRLVDDPTLRFHGIVSEAALHLAVGGPAVMRTQMLHLADIAKLPNVTFQVLPFSAGRDGAQTAIFTVLKFADPADPDVAFMEGLGGMIPCESERDVHRCNRLFRQLESVALSPEDSIALVLNRAEGWPRQRL